MKHTLLSLLLVLCTSLLRAQDPPNILFILTDDMGYSDVGFNQVENSPVNDIVTPNIDQLANEGTVFTSAYAVHMFCGPSRAGLMTGRYPHKIGSQFNLAGFSDHGVSGNETFVSKVLQDAGYYTGVIGKWHLGEEEQYHPNNRGYDHFYGFLGGGHRYFTNNWKTVAQTENLCETAKDGSFAEYEVALMRNKEFQENPSENLYLTDMLTSEGVSFLDQAKAEDKPFFLFMSYNAPHTLLEAKDADIEELKTSHNITFSDDNRATYSAMMFALDKQIKVLTDALKEKGMYDNTMIVFMSDNGGKLKNNASANNYPLTGGKGDIEEGGIRVPMFIHWPAGTTGAPSEYNHVVSGLDLYPTFVNLAKGTIPQGKELDGKDILPNVLANTDTRPEEPIFNLNVKSPVNYVSARMGKWKARTKGDGNWELFDLDADIEERSKVVGEDEVLTQLKDKAHEWAELHTLPEWFDNPDWNWEQKWNDSNMPNWSQTFPEGNIVTEADVAEGEVNVTALGWDGIAPTSIEIGQTYPLTITYAAYEDSAAYVVFYAKKDGEYNWKEVEHVRVPLQSSLSLTTTIVNIDIPESLDAGARARIHIGKAGLNSYKYSQRYTTTPATLMADVVAEGTGSEEPDPNSTLVIDRFIWEDDTRDGKELVGGSTQNAKIQYTGAFEGEKVYVIITYKNNGSYGPSSAQVEVPLTAGAGEAIVAVPARAMNTSDVNANTARITLGENSNANWGSRIDVAGDSNSANDAIYGAITSNSDNTGGEEPNGDFVVSSLTWENGSKQGMKLAQNQSGKIKLSYTGSTGDNTIYAIVGYKDGGKYGASTEEIEVVFPKGDGELLVDLPFRSLHATDSDANVLRVFLSETSSATWKTRFDVANDAKSGTDVIYGTLIEESGGGEEPDPESHLSISRFIWDNDVRDGKQMPANGTVKAKVEYTGATADEKLYAILCYKDAGSFTASTEQIEIVFPEGDGTVLVNIPVRAMNATNDNANLARVQLGTTITAVWKDRIDVAADGNSANDAIFGTVTTGSSESTTPLTVSAFTWEDGSKEGLSLIENTSQIAKITYENASVNDKIYAIVTYKTAGTYGASTEQIEITLTEGDGTATVSILAKAFNANDADANLVRVALSTSTDDAWANHVDVASDSNAANDGIFGTVAQEVVEPIETLKVTAFTWADGTVENMEITENTTVDATITYTGAAANDQLFAIVTYKTTATYGASTEQIEMTLTEGSGTATVSIPAKVFDTSDAEANLVRVTLSRSTDDAWANRVDVASDNNEANDGIFGTVAIVTGAFDYQKTSFSVYPNPAKDLIRINSSLEGTVKLVNPNGCIVRSFHKTEGEVSHTISDLTKGIYFVQLQCGAKVYTQKILVVE